MATLADQLASAQNDLKLILTQQPISQNACTIGTQVGKTVTPDPKGYYNFVDQTGLGRSLNSTDFFSYLSGIQGECSEATILKQKAIDKQKEIDALIAQQATDPASIAAASKKNLYTLAGIGLLVLGVGVVIALIIRAKNKKQKT